MLRPTAKSLIGDKSVACSKVKYPQVKEFIEKCRNVILYPMVYVIVVPVRIVDPTKDLNTYGLGNVDLNTLACRVWIGAMVRSK
ncbi:putative cellulose synthase (UDP-forming) [Helianthus debilis subsp. tardiflorus]